MSVVLCHESALRYWLTKISNEAVPSVSPCQSLSFSSANMRDVRLDALSFDYSEKRPLHVLVCDSDSVRNQRCLVAHRWSGVLPPGSFYELSGSNLVSSPEFTFLQMAAGRSLREVVEIGDYLCGLFSIGDSGHGYTGQRDALTTPESIAGFLDQAPGAYGAKQARRALRYVVERTASPREIMLCSALVLPKSVGGGFVTLSRTKRSRFPSTCGSSRVPIVSTATCISPVRVAMWNTIANSITRGATDWITRRSAETSWRSRV